MLRVADWVLLVNWIVLEGGGVAWCCARWCKQAWQVAGLGGFDGFDRSQHLDG